MLELEDVIDNNEDNLNKYLEAKRWLYKHESDYLSYRIDKE